MKTVYKAETVDELKQWLRDGNHAVNRRWVLYFDDGFWIVSSDGTSKEQMDNLNTNHFHLYNLIEGAPSLAKLIELTVDYNLSYHDGMFRVGCQTFNNETMKKASKFINECLGE